MKSKRTIKKDPKSHFRILVVDDEAEIAATISEALKSDSCEIEIENDGVHGLQRIDEALWDLLIVDLKLPRVTGMDLLKHFRQAHQDGEAIVITGHGTLKSAVQAMEVGAHSYLLKPFSLEQLGFTVERTLEKIRIKRENRELVEELVAKNGQLEKVIQSLHDTRDQMIKKERLAAIGELTVTINHRFKNALSGILGAIDVLEKDADIHPKKGRLLEKRELVDVVHKVRKESERLLTLVDKIGHLDQADSTTYIGDIKMLALEE